MVISPLTKTGSLKSQAVVGLRPVPSASARSVAYPVEMSAALYSTHLEPWPWPGSPKKNINTLVRGGEGLRTELQGKSTLKGRAEDAPVKGTKKELSAFEENQEGFILTSKREDSSKKGRWGSTVKC